MNRRIIIIILDSVGIGELPDAASFGDKGCNTLGHIASAGKSLNLINLGAAVDIWLTVDSTQLPLPEEDQLQADDDEAIFDNN